MKNKLILIFTIYFSFSSFGLAFGTHTCGKKISHSLWGIPLSAKKSCSCKHDEDPAHTDKCCKSTTKWLKSDSESSKVKPFAQFNKAELFSATTERVSFSFLSSYEVAKAPYRVSHTPPINRNSFFIEFRSLLI